MNDDKKYCAECYEAEAELLSRVHLRQLEREIEKMIEKEKSNKGLNANT